MNIIFLLIYLFFNSFSSSNLKKESDTAKDYSFDYITFNDEKEQNIEKEFGIDSKQQFSELSKQSEGSKSSLKNYSNPEETSGYVPSLTSFNQTILPLPTAKGPTNNFNQNNFFNPLQNNDFSNITDDQLEALFADFDFDSLF